MLQTALLQQCLILNIIAKTVVFRSTQQTGHLSTISDFSSLLILMHVIYCDIFKFIYNGSFTESEIFFFISDISVFICDNLKSSDLINLQVMGNTLNLSK